MAIDIDSALGIHQPALSLRARRAEILAANLANADTPNYKARDIDFRAALRKAADETLPLAATHGAHIQPTSATPPGTELLYRVPHQASLDGNTVDAHVEQAEFTQNAIQYQASLTFLDRRFKGLLTALKGE